MNNTVNRIRRYIKHLRDQRSARVAEQESFTFNKGDRVRWNEWYTDNLFQSHPYMNFNEWYSWREHVSSQESTLDPRISLFGTKNPTDYVAVGKQCIIEQDCSFWISPNDGASPYIEIGDQTFIGRNTYFGVHKRISIGSMVMIGAYSYIISANHCFDRRDIPMRNQGFSGDPITISDDVWIGTHVVILPGVTVGRGAIIAAGSILNKDVPQYQIWGGTPARFLKDRP